MKSHRHSFRLPKLPTLAYASFTSLLIFGLAFFISYGNNQKQPSNAETGDTINITAAGNLTLNLESTPIGNMATVSDQVTVTHKIADGHKLLVSTDSNNNNLNLDNNPSASYYLIPTIKGQSLAMNSWGYTLDSQENINNQTANFSFIPKLDQPSVISSLDSTTIAPYGQEVGGSTTYTVPTNITYAIKANTSLQNGTYSNNIVYTAISNHIARPTFGGITTMQEMTPEICQAETTPHAYRDGAPHNSDYSNIVSETTREHTTDKNKVPEAVLTDTRDGKTYVVRKLADSNCWMSQNLAIGGNRTITSADSDLKEGRSFTFPARSVEGDTWVTDGTYGPHYLNPDPEADFMQNGTTPSPGGQPTESTGNYYDWPMATAGARDVIGNSLIGANSGQAADSICPKGWMLPDTETNRMLILYDYEIPVGDSGVNDNLLLAAPFNRIRAGGYIDGDFESQGSFGGLWSSEIGGAGTAQTFMFNESAVLIAASAPFGSPISVRCVAHR